MLTWIKVSDPLFSREAKESDISLGCARELLGVDLHAMISYGGNSSPHRV
jgi:hypothetical protein